jgi:TonB family protein
MRVEFLPSIDFNQMLVYSTFAHLLFLTWVMFLPDHRIQEQIIVPTFRLDLIELSPKAKPVPPSKKKRAVLSPIIKKKAAPKAKPIVKKLKRSKLKPKAKQLPPPKPIIKESKARKKILEDLKSLESNSIKRSPLEQLDLLARLAPKVQEEKVIPPKAMQEETFREPEREKVAELPMEPEPKVELPVEPEPKVELPVEPEQGKLLPRVDDTEITAKERELIALSEQLVKLDLKKESQSTSALLKELEAIENKEVHPADVSMNGEQFERSDSISAFKDIKGESFTSVVEKFQELEESSEEIKIDVSQGQMVLEEFKTSIQRGGVPISETKTEPETSSALSLYVGKVYKRVYSKWKTPLGSKFKNVTVSFTIFSKGNINSPVIRKSAGDKNLDSIAVSAIMDSVPFPELPEELNRPNLKINIIFKYVPEKN